MTEAELAIRTLKDPTADAASLLSSVAHVPVSEPSSLWSDVANDAAFPLFHRSIAAWQLIKRHVPPGIPLGEAATRLAGATWLDSAEIEKITVLGGELPVVVPDGGSAIIVRLPRGSANEVPMLGAYLAFDRDTEVATLRAALASRPAGAALAGARVTGVAVFPETLGAPSK